MPAQTEQCRFLLLYAYYKFDPELEADYDRKVLNGKPKMCVINAVRFKLLARVVSVVKNDKE